MHYEDELAAAKNIALAAGEVMLTYFDEDQQIERKSDNTPVTIADKRINDLVIERLSGAFPGDGIIGEEKSTAQYGEGRKWFCDPIDGTKAYVWGVPTAMFSLGLVVDGVPVMGVAYDPFLKRMYEGVSGEGSFCNGKRLAVSKEELKGSTVAITSTAEKIRTLSYIKKLEEKGARLASFSGGVYKGCLVARAKFSGYFESGLNAHDMAALEVIVVEAGGKVSSMTGEKLDYTKPFKGALVSNNKIHQALVQIINS